MFPNFNGNCCLLGVNELPTIEPFPKETNNTHTHTKTQENRWSEAKCLNGAKSKDRTIHHRWSHRPLLMRE